MLQAMSLPLPVTRIAAAALTTLLLAACGRDPDTGENVKAITGLAEDFDGVWQGVLPCADCAGIEVELTLRRAPSEPAQFRLTERYLGGVDEGEFSTEGGWREDPCSFDNQTGRCIVLAEVAQRWFRHEDGSLQAIDAEGRPIDLDSARLTRR